MKEGNGGGNPSVNIGEGWKPTKNLSVNGGEGRKPTRNSSPKNPDVETEALSMGINALSPEKVWESARVERECMWESRER